MLSRKLLMLALSGLLCCSVAAQSSEDWPAYGGNLGGQRYSGATQIQTRNVHELQVAWTFHTHVFDKPSPSYNHLASFEATPILFNGSLYFDTPFDTVFAVDAATGKQRWVFDPGVDRAGPIYIVTSRGVAIWRAAIPKRGLCGSAAVLVTTTDRRLIARDAATGLACPAFGNHGTVDLSKGVHIGSAPGWYEFTSPPTVVGDTIVLGSTVADNQTTFAASGAVRGFSAVTGAQKWSWEPIRAAGTVGPGGTGSGNAWSVLSADPERDLVFVPTGSPSVDFYGGTRPGDNRDADSLVALRASTGERVWAFQLVHHDLWDYDTPSEPLLFTFRGQIPAVAVTTKSNMIFVFNRVTGQPLYPIEERAVPTSTLPGEQTSPTQPFSLLPPLAPLSFTAKDVHLHDPQAQAFCQKMLKGLDNRGLFTPPSRLGTLYYPGSLGGANWGSSAFDPYTGVMYTRVSTLPFIVRETRRIMWGTDFRSRLNRMARRHLPTELGGDPLPLETQFGTPDGGGAERDADSQIGTPYTIERQAIMTPDEVPCGPQPFGSIVATNLNTGKRVWSVPHGVMAKGELGSIGDGGVIATAGGLVFGASTNDPYLRAYDSATGRELWRGDLPAPANATPMSYAIHGRQFVVIAAGGHGFIGKGKSDAVIAFALPEIPKSAKVGAVRR